MNKEELKEITKITKEEKDKRLVMWSGVIFFMILIIFLWFLNTRKVFSLIGDNGKENNFDVSEATEEFNKAFEELSEKMNAMSQQLMATTSLEEEQEVVKKDEDINKESIEALKEKLEASSTDNIYEKEQ